MGSSMSPLSVPVLPRTWTGDRQRSAYEEETYTLNQIQTSVQSGHNASQFKHPLTEFKNEWHVVQWLRHLASNLALLQRLWVGFMEKQRLNGQSSRVQGCKSVNIWSGWIGGKCGEDFGPLEILCPSQVKVLPKKRWILKLGASNTLTLVPVRSRSCCDVLHFHGLRPCLHPWWSHIMVLCKLTEYTSFNSLG